MVLLQTLSDLGLDQTRKTLETEAGVQLPSLDPDHASFFRALENGQFDSAIEMLPLLPLKDYIALQQDRRSVFSAFPDLSYLSEHTEEPGPESVPVTNDATLEAARFLIVRQKCLELLLFEQSPKEAALCLRGLSSEGVFKLTSLILDETSDENYLDKLGFKLENPKVESRSRLCSEVGTLFAPTALVPPHRLATLLSHARAHQRSQNLISGSSQPWSLFQNTRFDHRLFPCKIVQTLVFPGKEVWLVRFLRRGKYLAVACNSSAVSIFRVEADGSVKRHRMLSGHTMSVLTCCWSYDDRHLLTAGFDSQVNVWDVESGTLIQLVSLNSKPKEDAVAPVVQACAWLEDGTFVAGLPEKELVHFSATGDEIFRWSGSRVLDLVVTQGHIITLSKTNLSVFNLELHRKVRSVVVGRRLTTLLLLKTEPRHVLIQGTPDVMQIWDWTTGMLVQRFTGQILGSYVIRLCFSAPDEAMILSGTETGRICVWSRKYAALVVPLKGHALLVNCVEFHPEGRMFASGGDDGRVRIWGPEAGEAEKSLISGKLDLEMSEVNEIVEAEGSSDSEGGDDDARLDHVVSMH